jgi:hypothetical protein
MQPIPRTLIVAAALAALTGAAEPDKPKDEERARAAAAPCEHLPEHRQFDFWVGEWDVHDPAGRKAGTNSVRKMPGGCVLFESWTSVSGSPGQSLNFYDPTRRKWVQIWVDARASVLRIEGEFREGAMRLAGDHVARDGGRTWYVWFDGRYRRRAE